MTILPSKVVNIIGFPVDLGAGRRGVDMGPSAMRISQISERLQSLGYKVIDDGNIQIEIIERQIVGNPQMKYLKEILKRSEILAKKVEKSLSEGNFPLVLGGDHSMSIGSVAGIASFCKKNNLRLGVIWIDAHTDMNTDETSPSGNIHGMPLASLLGLGNKSLTHFYGFAPKVKPENCVVIGARSIDPMERKNIRKIGLQVYTMADVDKIGIHRIISRVLKQFKNSVDHIHISFDVDSVDPSVAPGVGTPVPGGLSYRETHLLMEAIAECGCMSSLEITEVNPILDHKNQTALFAAEVIASSMGQRIL
ncbi:MAG: arginase [Ignavibacteriaceae bacterium]